MHELKLVCLLRGIRIESNERQEIYEFVAKKIKNDIELTLITIFAFQNTKTYT